MNIKRALLITMAAMLLPLGNLMAGHPPLPQPQPGDALFLVNTNFVDGNDTVDVTLRMQCNGGNPTQQEVTVPAINGHGSVEAGFVLTNIPSEGTFECEIWQMTDAAGYEQGYRCNGEGSDPDCRAPGNDATSCFFDGVVQDQLNFCRIRNVPGEVDVVVTKEWIYPTDGGQDVEQEVRITLECNAPIDGYYYVSRGYWRAQKTILGDGDAVFSVQPTSFDPGNTCRAWEDINDSRVEQTIDGCGSMSVTAGSGDSCTITNTVFFEGIPTLNQYGMAIMALLMLGIGFVGFRRFV
ncbi:MAG: IPTL-CTERM sorting domain-containing protein [Gammaproteobacteria bacterium]|nr:IPTL-CTERM sorting domain-containing protein [Gammaproteobacteria bacterium]